MVFAVEMAAEWDLLLVSSQPVVAEVGCKPREIFFYQTASCRSTFSFIIIPLAHLRPDAQRVKLTPEQFTNKASTNKCVDFWRCTILILAQSNFVHKLQSPKNQEDQEEEVTQNIWFSTLKCMRNHFIYWNSFSWYAFATKASSVFRW